jgi:hypothetical protein
MRIEQVLPFEIAREPELKGKVNPDYLQPGLIQVSQRTEDPELTVWKVNREFRDRCFFLHIRLETFSPRHFEIAIHPV